MKCALAALGFVDEDIAYNKAVLAKTLEQCAGKVDVVLFGEAFLQGFYGVNFTVAHDREIAIPRDDALIHELCGMAKKYAVAVSFGFLERDGDIFFSSQMTIDRTGRMIDLYRRVSPGWKEPYAGKEYREGRGFHTFDFCHRKVAVGLCGDLWYEENIAALNARKPDVVWWPVYTDYTPMEWNRTKKHEYAEQSSKINAPVLYVNSVCLEKLDESNIAKGGAVLFDKGIIKAELPAGSEGILIVEV
ncbi:MAG TPA: carbon-nitrogen hydrolase family protein [Clostridiales bacterium]|nr:carbon-nitrogen hydrolase family protein [Clostridiales bacterium]